MDKFGLFNSLSKLATNENALNSITKLIKTVASNNANQEISNKPKANKVIKAHYDTKAIQDVLKRHDEISKFIDLQNKK